MVRFVLLFFSNVLLLSWSIAQSVEFDNGTWQQIRDKARFENKYILLDAFATWCVPCKEMDRKVFNDVLLAELLNKKFVSVKVQMDRSDKDSERVKSWYNIADSIRNACKLIGYPTLLLLNSSAELVGRIEGFRSAGQLIDDLGKIVNDNNDFEKRYSFYLCGNRDTSFVKMLATEADRIGRRALAHAIAQEFINGLSISELLQNSNLSFAYKYTSSTTDRTFWLFKKHSKLIDSLLELSSNRSTRTLINGIIYTEEIEPLINGPNPDWSTIKRNIIKKVGAIDREYYAGVRMMHASKHKRWSEFGAYYLIYYKTAFNHSTYHINNLSWLIFEHVSDPKVLDVAIRTMKHNNANYDKEDAMATDTYANLLYKRGRVKEAIAWQSRAVEMDMKAAAARNVQANISLSKTLAKMKAGIPTWKTE